MNESNRRSLIAFRVVQGATLAALLWKIAFYIAAAKVYFELPLRQRFFPEFLESPRVIATAYIAVVIGLLVTLVTRSDRMRIAVAWWNLASVSVLCLHQGSYNDATFTTAWWVLLWSAWFAGRVGRGDALLIDRGARLARRILAIVFLGGAVGKWTAEYWSGEVLYEIYFIDRDFWLFNLLRAKYEPETLRHIATWYSRHVIVVESFCGLALWGLPPRLAAITGLAVCVGIASLSSFYLFSVVLSLMGLAAVGLFVPAKQVEEWPSA